MSGQKLKQAITKKKGAKKGKKQASEEVVEEVVEEVKDEIQYTTMLEKVKLSRAIELLQSDYFENVTIDQDRCKWPVQDFNTVFEFYNKRGEVTRCYETKESNPKGRQFAQGGLGLQGLSKPLRAYLCQDDYIDIDICNSIPSALIMMMMTAGYEDMDLLLDYIDKKDEWRANHKDIKRRVIVQINSDCKRYDDSIPHGKKESKVIDLLRSIYNFVKDIKDLYLQVTTIERRVLDKMIEVIGSEEAIKIGNDGIDIRINTLIYDGMLVEKVKNPEKLMELINVHIFPFKAEIKKWDIPKYDMTITKTVDKKVPIIKIRDMNVFDYKDPIIFNDVLDLSGMEVDNIEQVYMIMIPLFIKTVRYIGQDTILTKLILESISESYALRKDSLVKNWKMHIGGKVVYMAEILSKLRGLIGFDKITPLRNPSQLNVKHKIFSTFSGYLCDHIPLPPDWKDRLGKFKYHILNVYSNGDPAIENGFYYFYANVIQTDTKSQVMMATTGREGAGKSIIPTFIIEKILGSRGLIASTLFDVSGSFNAHLANKRLVLINEISNIDSYQKHTDSNQLKHMIDGRQYMMELKGVDKVAVANMLEIVGASNYKNCIPQCDGMNRRTFVIEVNDKYSKDSEYFTGKDGLVNYLEDPDNVRSIFEFLNTYDISDKQTLIKLPITQSKMLGMYRSFNPVFKGILLACIIHKKDTNKDGEILLNCTDLRKIIIMNEIMGDHECKNGKMADYINDYIDKKQVYFTNPRNILTMHIVPEELKIPKDMWEFINDIVTIKNGLREESEMEQHPHMTPQDHIDRLEYEIKGLQDRRDRIKENAEEKPDEKKRLF